jgi:hypothetical protein
VDVVKATPDMFDGIYAVLREFGGNLTREDWKRLLDYRFSDQGYRGWVSVVNGEVIGYLGAIFSRRGDERFCNLTSWIVKKEHRKGNLKLLEPMLDLTDHTVLNLSPSAFTYALFKKLGFSVLDEEIVLIPPVTLQRTPPGFKRVRGADLERTLSAQELQLFRDHQPYGLCHLVLSGPQGHLYVVASKTSFRRLPVSCIHHVSNPALLGPLLNVVQRELRRDHRTLLTLADARLVERCQIRGGLRHRLARPRLYRPGRPAPVQPIDTLYTELVVHNPRRWVFNG